jgi:hypothetical protein
VVKFGIPEFVQFVQIPLDKREDLCNYLREFGESGSLLHLWIFAPPITQKSRLSGLLSEFAG